MPRTTKKTSKDLRFEEALAGLERIVRDLEGGDLPLDDALKLFEEGVRLSRFCGAKLDEAEKKIEILMKGADGEWRANAETGEMEWHAADGSVISESDWQAQAAAGGTAEVEVADNADLPATAEEFEAAESVAETDGEAADVTSGAEPSTDEDTPAEGSASDEADNDADQAGSNEDGSEASSKQNGGDD